MEILNPPAKRLAVDPAKYLLPKDSDFLLPSLSKSQILASSPSAFALHEKIGGIFGLQGLLPFTKKESAALKGAKLDDSFSLASYQRVLALEGKKTENSNSAVFIEELERTWIEFYKCSTTDPIQKKTLLCTALCKFDTFAAKAAKELFDENKFCVEGFGKQFKFGQSVLARFLCDYSQTDAENVAKKTLKAHSFAKTQQIILQKLLNNDISVNVFAFVESNGYMLVIRFKMPEAVLGVQMDDYFYTSSVCTSVGLSPEKDLAVYNYNLEGKLMCHIGYTLENVEVLPQDSLLSKLDNLECLPDGRNEFYSISSEQFLEVTEKSEAFHSKHFCFIELVGFALACVVREHCRRSFIEAGIGFDCREIICFILNSLADSSFFTCILRTKFNVLYKKPALFAQVLQHI